MPKVTITQLTTERVLLQDFYMVLPGNTPTKTQTLIVDRTFAELQTMNALHQTVAEGKVSVAISLNPGEQGNYIAAHASLSHTDDQWDPMVLQDARSGALGANQILVSDGAGGWTTILVPVSGGTTDHGALGGLADDDHTQYILEDGTRAFSGDADLGGNDLTNVNLVDGVDVSAHAARHAPGGADALATAVPVDVGTANALGSAATLARSDHVHDHADQPGGTLHDEATTIDAGFMSSADKTKLDGVDTGATSTPLAIPADTPAPVAKSSPLVGVSSRAARADHRHEASTGIPVDVGSANAAGTSTDLARADHVHNHGNQAGGTTHAIATPATAGFLSASDKTKLDTVATGATATPLTAALPQDVDRTGALAGTATSAARADHKHDISTAVPVTIGTTNSAGAASSLARSDHLHAHGNQAGGTLHVAATTVTNGFMSAADKTKLDGVEPLADVTDTTNVNAAGAVMHTDVAPPDGLILKTGSETYTTVKVNYTAVSDPLVSNDSTQGYSVGSQWLNTATNVMFVCFDASVGAAVWADPGSGEANTASNIGAGGVGVYATKVGVDLQFRNINNADGSMTVAFDGGNQEIDLNVNYGAISAVGTANNNGVAATAARSDHVHSHSNLPGGSLHADATVAVAGFMAAADKLKLDGIASGATNTPLTAAAPADVTKAPAVVGVSGQAARADHKHDILTNTPSTIGSSNSEGTAASVARSDHIHAHGNQGGGTLHALATVSVNGFMSAADKSKLNGIAAGAVADHGALSGLADDDHTRYLLISGTRAMSGNLDLGTNNIVNVGEVNGIRLYGALGASPFSPPPADGDEYYNTVLSEKMYYDGARSKWLSIQASKIEAGRNGNTAAGSFYRMTDGLTMDAVNLGFPVPKGTLTYLAWTRDDADAATLEVLVNGAVITTLASAVAGPTVLATANSDFNAGVMSFRNQAGGNPTTDVQIVAIYKRRP